MVKYDVWFKHFCVGKLYVNEEGQHKYVVDIDAVEKAEKDDEVLFEAKTDRDWGNPIRFFEFLVGNAEGHKECASHREGSCPICAEYYLIKNNH